MGSADLKKIPAQDLSRSSAFSVKANQGPSPAPEQKSPAEIKLSPSEILRLASAGTGITRSSPRQWNPLWFSPLSFFSVSGCDNQGPCAGNQCNAPADSPDAATGPSENPNRSPALNGLRDLRGTVGEELKFQFTATAHDGDGCDVHLQATHGVPYPENASLHRLNTYRWEFSWTPQAGQEGDHEVDIIATSGLNLKSGRVKITVLPNNQVQRDAGADVGLKAGATPGTSEGGTDSGGGVVNPYCVPSGKGLGTGTPDDPYTFRVLLVMEESTRMLIEAQGWNVAAGVERIFSRLNAGYNNGQLAGHYRLISAGVRFEPEWANTNYLSTSQTPEEDDLIIAFDPDKGSSGGVYYSSAKMIIFGGIYLFEPDREEFILIHEVGHFRSAIDLYRVGVGPHMNQIFRGAGHYILENSYMQGNNRYAVPNWDSLSAGMINAAAGDPNLDYICGQKWLREWVPKNLLMRVVNQNGEPVNQAQVKIYRHRHLSREPLNESALWFTGTTNGSGIVQLPKGITVPDLGSGFNDVVLGAIIYNRESYLNWYDIRNFFLPYLEGKTDLVLEAKVNETTRYREPKSTDIEVLSLEVSSTTPTVEEFINRTFVVRNNGPETLEGRINHQFLISKDLDFQLYSADIANGGENYLVKIAPGETKTITKSNWIPPNVTPGVYYLQVKVDPWAEGYWDPDDSNNAAVSVPITVMP